MPGAPQSYIQWEKSVVNAAFVDGAGPGPAAATNILEELIWEETFDYLNQPAAEQVWDGNVANWVFDADADSWDLDGAQISPAVLKRIAPVVEVEIGDVIVIRVRFDGNELVGDFAVAYDLQPVVSGIAAPGEYAGVITAGTAAGVVEIGGGLAAAGRLGYVSIGFFEAYRTFRDTNNNPITVA